MTLHLLFTFSTLSALSLSATTTPAAATGGGETTTGLQLTFVNNCNFSVWPAIQPNVGFPVLHQTGFHLPTLTIHSFSAPSGHWSGRIWARTACTYTDNTTQLICATGDCDGRLECGGLGGQTPATVAQLRLHCAGGTYSQGRPDGLNCPRVGPAYSSYGVSLVDGFNVPMTVTPHEGSGFCPVVGCAANILATCPQELQVRSPPGSGAVVACKSACQAFGTDELCCMNGYNSPATCRPSSYSRFFKEACPATLTYAHDTPSLLVDGCSAPRELKVIFCQ